jgi:hypothetical protein
MNIRQAFVGGLAITAMVVIVMLLSQAQKEQKEWQSHSSREPVSEQVRTSPTVASVPVNSCRDPLPNRNNNIEGCSYIRGTIKNYAPNASSMKVVYKFYDSSGAVIGYREDSISLVQAGESWSFNVYVPRFATTARLQNVESNGL